MQVVLLVFGNTSVYRHTFFQQSFRGVVEGIHWDYDYITGLAFIITAIYKTTTCPNIVSLQINIVHMLHTALLLLRNEI